MATVAAKREGPTLQPRTLREHASTIVPSWTNDAVGSHQQGIPQQRPRPQRMPHQTPQAAAAMTGDLRSPYPLAHQTRVDTIKPDYHKTQQHVWGTKITRLTQPWFETKYWLFMGQGSAAGGRSQPGLRSSLGVRGAQSLDDTSLARSLGSAGPPKMSGDKCKKWPTRISTSC
jgi:hypothetical protein